MVLEGSEQELIEACRRGDRDAFRELFETYRNRVYSVAARFAGDEAAAMDIAQDTFLKLFSSIRDFRGDSSFDTWIYRLVVNSCLDHRRRSRRLIPLADEFLRRLRASGDSLAEMLRAEAGGRVRSVVDKLSPDLRIVIVLRYTEGLSYEQIAEVLGCSQGTVASRLNRAHKTLERRLAHLVNEKEAAVSDWLELELAQQLRPLEAPEELWARVERAQSIAGRQVPNPTLAAWPIAATLLLAAATLWIATGRTAPIDVQQVALEQLRSIRPLDLASSDPDEISRWIRRWSGIDVQLPAGAARLAGARLVRRGGQKLVAVAYRVGDDSATLLVAQAGACRVESRHRLGLAVWKSREQVYALACSNPDRPRAACLLCHTSL